MHLKLELSSKSDSLRISIESGSGHPSSAPNQSAVTHNPHEHGLRLIAVEGRIVERPVVTRSTSPDRQVDHRWDGLSY